MKTVSISELRYINAEFEISDIFPESWVQRKEFSLYQSKARPCSALFFVCSDIDVSFFTEKYSVSAKKGDIVFIPQGSLYRACVTCKTKEKTDTYTVNFFLFDENKESVLLSDRICVLGNRQDNLFDLHLKNLFDTFYRVENFCGMGTRNLARTKGEFFLLLDLISESASQYGDYYPIRKGIKEFCDEWNKNERIEKYARICGMSETYFYRCFRKWSGASPIEYRNMLRLSNAESMLRCTDMKIKEISEMIGYDDPFYFCRIFSQKYGVSPQKYRKRMQNQR